MCNPPSYKLVYCSIYRLKQQLRNGIREMFAFTEILFTPIPVTLSIKLMQCHAGVKYLFTELLLLCNIDGTVTYRYGVGADSVMGLMIWK